MRTPPETPERGGLILDDGTVVELQNLSDEPNEGAVLNPTDDQLEMFDRAVATWHTHPGASANLSVGDYETFVNQPQLQHAIVGDTEVRWYAVKNGAVVNA